MYCKFAYLLVVVFIAIAVYVLWYASNAVESFSSEKVGKYYSADGLGGTATDAHLGKQVTLRINGMWLIRSSNISREYCFRITSKGVNRVIYMRNPGRLDNLPAALGGLPAHHGYSDIFNNPEAVMVEIVPVEVARADLNQLTENCLTTHDAGYCKDEFTPLL